MIEDHRRVSAEQISVSLVRVSVRVRIRAGLPAEQLGVGLADDHDVGALVECRPHGRQRNCAAKEASVEGAIEVDRVDAGEVGLRRLVEGNGGAGEGGGGGDGEGEGEDERA